MSIETNHFSYYLFRSRINDTTERSLLVPLPSLSTLRSESSESYYKNNILKVFFDSKANCASNENFAPDISSEENFVK